MSIRVAVLGAAGRMGSQVVAAVDAAEGLELVSAIDVADSLDQLVDRNVQVAVDFTSPSAVMGNLEYCLANGISMVVGTSGFDDEKYLKLRELVTRNPAIGVIVAPNFGIAAVLMMQFSAKAARFFDSVEIIELHHPQKVDAPSGTARRTAELISQSRAAAECQPMPDATVGELPGARGAQIGGVRIHSARVMGMIAHQEVIFGGPGELLTIRHDSMDRASFMPGVILAVREVVKRPGLTVGLEHLLDLDT